MNEIVYDPELCHDFSRSNQRAVKSSKQVGCFACYHVFDSKEIRLYSAYDSAICPSCGYDSIIPDSEVPVATDDSFLKKMHTEWYVKGRTRPKERMYHKKQTVVLDAKPDVNMSLAELELSIRTTNRLESEGITTVRDLVIRNDDEILENFGETILREVKTKLRERGLSLSISY